VNNCGEAMELDLFPTDCGGSIPTSPLQLHCLDIGPKAAATAYKNWHYLGDTDFISSFNYGVYFNQRFMGAITYGPPNAAELDGFFDRYSQKQWYEIKRFALSSDCPRNSESRVIAVTMRLLRKRTPVKGVITYADSGQGHVGTIYKAAGFQSHGLTAKKSDFYVNGKIQQRGKTKMIDGEWKERTRKYLFSKRFASKKLNQKDALNQEKRVEPNGTTP